MKELYPEIEAYNTGFLAVSNTHSIYFEESGNPKGIPVVHLHGGPGAASSPKNRQNYDAKKYRIVLFDQRGCGQSTPQGELSENTTADLIEDMEKLRQHLKIEKWVVSGGSWGSTLALAYAQTYPEYVMALFVRGIFLAREKEVAWSHDAHGAASLFPDLYEPYRDFIPQDKRDNFPQAYLDILNGDDYELKKQAAITHLTWEGGVSKMEFRLQEEAQEKLENPPEEKEETDFDFLITLSKMLNHYTVNNFFMEDGALLKNIDKIQDIPGVIIQGRYDVVCPVQSAWELHKAWPKSELVIVPDCGHSGSEPPTVDAIIHATNKIANWF
jgi:proline iminopeptidase